VWSIPNTHATLAAERLSRTLNDQQSAPHSARCYIDALRTPCTSDGEHYYDEFFSTLDFDSAEDLLAAVISL
jgi:hypothetical protein